MNSLDANVVLRYLLQDIQEQYEKSSRLIIGSVCYVSDVIITEAAFVLEKRLDLSREDVVSLLKGFIGLPTVVCNDGLLHATIALFASSEKLSFPDCYAAVEARLNQDTLVTFDKDLIRFGGEHVTTL